jgi:sigma-B regulation protein RsbU (phosphoserine phosphatase)
MGPHFFVGQASGWSVIFFLLLVASWIGFYFFYQRQARILDSQKRARHKAELEESRVFDFLHGLGEAFSSEIRPDELHRLIVEGATRITDAQAGALYLQQGLVLVPRFMTKGCPPLIEIPPHVLKQAESIPQAVQTFLRLHGVESGEGLVGKIWRDQEVRLFKGAEPEVQALQQVSGSLESAMLAPLIYANENLGVLAVVNSRPGAKFNDNDLLIFKAIAEQSAFALYNAIIYSQAHEKKRLDLDIQVAQDIQRILLPAAAPIMAHYEIDGVNIPARQMSGDYFGYIRVDETRWGVAIADVSGKGVPASLIMAMCRSVLRSNAAGDASAANVLHKVNQQLFPDIKEDMFISMAYVILDDASDTITLCRAGHDAPLLYSARSKTVTKLNPPGMALGIDSGDVFDRITGDFSVSLEENDCLILYTDGVTEALDSKGTEFGLKRMIQAIQNSAPDGAVAIKKRLTDELVDFIGTYPLNDDVTVIVIRRK